MRGRVCLWVRKEKGRMRGRVCLWFRKEKGRMRGRVYVWFRKEKGRMRGRVCVWVRKEKGRKLLLLAYLPVLVRSQTASCCSYMSSFCLSVELDLGKT
jgi:hypothetical protein